MFGFGRSGDTELGIVALSWIVPRRIHQPESVPAVSLLPGVGARLPVLSPLLVAGEMPNAIIRRRVSGRSAGAIVAFLTGRHHPFAEVVVPGTVANRPVTDKPAESLVLRVRVDGATRSDG